MEATVGSKRNSVNLLYWSHLLRDFQAISERRGVSQEIGRILKVEDALCCCLPQLKHG